MPPNRKIIPAGFNLPKRPKVAGRVGVSRATRGRGMKPLVPQPGKGVG